MSHKRPYLVELEHDSNGERNHDLVMFVEAGGPKEAATKVANRIVPTGHYGADLRVRSLAGGNHIDSAPVTTYWVHMGRHIAGVTKHAT